MKVVEDSKRKSLGEQTLVLKAAKDRVTALRRTTAATQVTLARSMVLRALSLLAVRYEAFTWFIVAPSIGLLAA